MKNKIEKKYSNYYLVNISTIRLLESKEKNSKLIADIKESNIVKGIQSDSVQINLPDKSYLSVTIPSQYCLKNKEKYVSLINNSSTIKKEDKERIISFIDKKLVDVLNYIFLTESKLSTGQYDLVILEPSIIFNEGTGRIESIIITKFNSYEENTFSLTQMLIPFENEKTYAEVLSSAINIKNMNCYSMDKENVPYKLTKYFTFFLHNYTETKDYKSSEDVSPYTFVYCPDITNFENESKSTYQFMNYPVAKAMLEKNNEGFFTSKIEELNKSQFKFLKLCVGRYRTIATVVHDTYSKIPTESRLMNDVSIIFELLYIYQLKLKMLNDLLYIQIYLNKNNKYNTRIMMELFSTFYFDYKRNTIALSENCETEYYYSKVIEETFRIKERESQIESFLKTYNEFIIKKNDDEKIKRDRKTTLLLSILTLLVSYTPLVELFNSVFIGNKNSDKIILSLLFISILICVAVYLKKTDSYIDKYNL